MARGIVYNVPESEFKLAVDGSDSLSDVQELIGGGAISTIRKRMKELGLSLEEVAKNGAAKKPAAKKPKSKKPSKRKRSTKEEAPYPSPISEPSYYDYQSSRRGGLLGIPFQWWPVVALGGLAGSLALWRLFSGPTVDVADQEVREMKQWLSQVSERGGVATTRLDKIGPQVDANTKEIISINERVPEVLDVLPQAKSTLEQTKSMLEQLETRVQELRQEIPQTAPGAAEPTPEKAQKPWWPWIVNTTVGVAVGAVAGPLLWASYLAISGGGKKRLRGKPVMLWGSSIVGAGLGAVIGSSLD